MKTTTALTLAGFALAAALFLLTGCQKQGTKPVSGALSDQSPGPEDKGALREPGTILGPRTDLGVQINAENFGARICGVQWTLKQMILGGKDYRLAGQKPWVRFETDGSLKGFASVNEFHGTLTWDRSGRARLSPGDMTMMSGQEDLMEQESVFLKGLEKTTRLTRNKRLLTALSSDGRYRLVFYTPVYIY